MIEILQGDCRDVLKTLPDESVQCVVTSPPYWGLRDYGVDNQIGLEKTPQEYVATMVQVFRELKRVLKSDGTAWLNLGDSYCSIGHKKSHSGFGTSTLAGTESQEQFPTRRENDASSLGLKHKDLVGIPWRVAFALQDDGWWLRSDIIWAKPNPMPESVTDRPTKAHEYIFLLTKSPKYFYDADAIAEPASYAMHAQIEQGYEGEGQKDYEANGVQNPSDVKRRIIENAKRKSWKGSEFHTGKTGEHQLGRAQVRKPAGWDTGKGGHGTIHRDGRAQEVEYGYVALTRNKRTVWTVPTAPFKDAHFATFPPTLISPCILAGTKPGDTVLDPFGGSGTTGQVALGCGRKAILIELNPEYHKMIEKRTQVLGFQF